MEAVLPLAIMTLCMSYSDVRYKVTPSDSPRTHSTSLTLDPGWSSRMGFHRVLPILSLGQLLGGQRRKSLNVV